MKLIHSMSFKAVAAGALWAAPLLAAAVQQADEPLRFGINVISLGNQYATPAYSDAGLDGFLSAVKDSGFRQFSVSVIWAQMEPVQGAYNTANIQNIDRILVKAEQYGLDVMISFHTLFNEGDESWNPPPWLPQVATALTVNGETISAKSNKHIFYTPAVQRAYGNMVAYVAQALNGRAALKYISIFNEPYLQWSSTANENYFAPALSNVMLNVRQVSSKSLGVRFLPGWNPWSDDARKAIATSGWQSLDWIGLNVYADTNADYVTDGTVVWPMAERAVAAAHGAGKKLLVTEIGPGGSPAPQTDNAGFWSSLFTNRLPTFRPDAIQMWVAQNDGSFQGDSNSQELYNVLSASNTFTPYVQSEIIPRLKAGANSIARADCLFNWAENQYVSIAAPPNRNSAWFGEFYFRYYNGTNNYLGYSTADGRIALMGPASGGSVSYVGDMAAFLTPSGCM
jgi:hypothetical protein